MTEIVTHHITCSGDLPAFLAMPADAVKAPVMIQMHERYGLVQHTQDLAQRHAREGFVCIAPDFFHKHPDQAALHRGDAGYDMTDPEALEYFDAAIEAVAHVPQADPSRLVAMGVCQTARHPLVLAAHRAVSAALCWYGAAQDREWQVNAKFPVGLEDIIRSINCPVLGIFGEADHIISLDHIRRLRNTLEAAGKSFTIEVMPDAPHGWLNDTMPGRYRRDQAEAAWAIQRAFLTEVLDPAFDRSRIVQRYGANSSVKYDFSKNLRLE
jgi:carboxymethylenebutenolidase